jgi:glutathione peroxidase
MKTFILTFVMFLAGISIFGQSSFYDFTVKDINGNNFSFSSLKGKKVMVVNTASKCGFTPQYADLENLYKNYNSQNFVIIGFPANNFLNQEPGSDKEIQDYCKKNYGVTFPMMSKISVKGKDMAPLYKWLTSKSLNGVEDSEVKWNFQKYLVDENGKLFAVIYTKDKPDSPEVLDWLTKK